MSVTIKRRARRPRFCDTCQYHLLAYEAVSTSLGAIQPGDYYLLHTAFPWEEPNYGPHFWRLSECGSCAEQYGRIAWVTS